MYLQSHKKKLLIPYLCYEFNIYTLWRGILFRILYLREMEIFFENEDSMELCFKKNWLLVVNGKYYAISFSEKSCSYGIPAYSWVLCLGFGDLIFFFASHKFFKERQKIWMHTHTLQDYFIFRFLMKVHNFKRE